RSRSGRRGQRGQRSRRSQWSRQGWHSHPHSQGRLMGWDNPPVSWSEMERILSGRVAPGDGYETRGDGGDSPGWARRRERYSGAKPIGVERTPYAELHCHSNFSFLDGASHPEELVEAAALLGLDAIAITDHDGMDGVVRFAEGARELGVRAVFGAELSLGLGDPQNGVADPEGEHLLLLATGTTGYARLCRTITTGQLADGSEKGRPIYDLEQIVEETAGGGVVPTGCRKVSVRAALLSDGPRAALAELTSLVERFGRDRVYVELIDHGLPLDTTHNDLLAELAVELRLPTIATNAVHYAHPDRGDLAPAMAAVRARRSLDEIDAWLPPAPTAYLRSGAEMSRRFARYPGAVRRAAQLGHELAFDLTLVAPKLPPFEVAGHTENSYLR